jgi:UDP-N-acetylmuramate--alanine ligase
VLEDVRARIIDYTAETAPEIALLGDFNKENARAAAAAARAAFPDIKQGTIDRALSEFKGSWRRFEYKGETPSGALVYDDYAHHPTAMIKTLEAARAKFPDKRIVVAFHPHLYSRTKSLMSEFADALCRADKAFVAAIYPAREAPDPEVTNEILAARARERGGDVTGATFDQIRHAFLQEPSDSLLITMGAGDIYKVADQIAD